MWNVEFGYFLCSGGDPVIWWVLAALRCAPHSQPWAEGTREYYMLFYIFPVIRQFLCTRRFITRTPPFFWPFFHLPAACGILGSDFSWWVTVSHCLPAPGESKAAHCPGCRQEQEPWTSICNSQPRNASSSLGCPGGSGVLFSIVHSM
jgi:hypothetical protein